MKLLKIYPAEDNEPFILLFYILNNTGTADLETQGTVAYTGLFFWNIPILATEKFNIWFRQTAHIKLNSYQNRNHVSDGRFFVRHYVTRISFMFD